MIFGIAMGLIILSKINYSSYQLAHLSKLYSNGFNSLLICDGVGVGKTISAGYIIFHQSMILKKPVMVICPPVLVNKWIFEMKSKFDIDLIITTDSKSISLVDEEINFNHVWSDRAPVYISTFTTLSRNINPPSPNFGLVVIDEIHNIRNPESKSFLSINKFCRNSNFRVGLSATPVNNSISDLAAIFSVLNPQYLFQDLDNLFNDLWGLPILDCMNCVITRFLKDDISSHFTKRNLTNISLKYNLDYEFMVNEQLSIKYPGVRKGSFETISLLRMASSSPSAFYSSLGMTLEEDFHDPKLSALVDLISQKPNERWLIFTEFKKTAEYLSRNLTDNLVLTMSGDLSAEEREAHTYLFQKTENSIMIMTPVGSEGLDFQICSNLVNYDLHWNPMRIEQRIGRIDRIGQKKEIINIYNFNIIGSIDDKVFQVIGDKLSLINGSFIQNQPILDNVENNYSDLQNDILDDEISNAKLFLKSSRFYKKILSKDNFFINEISNDECKLELWESSDWSQGYPWFQNSLSWFNPLVIDSKKFLSLMKDYSQIRS